MQPTPAEEPIHTDEVPEIDVDELERRQAAGAAVFDVREPWEHQQARIAGVVLVPMGEVVAAVDRFRAAASHMPVYVVCGSGARSAHVVAYLQTLGIDAVNVAGGTGAWIEAGKPVEAGPAPG